MTLRIYESIRTIINVLLGIVAFFLVLRVLLRLFDASPIAPFVSWIYNISSSLMAPFAGMVSDIAIPPGVLDMVAIIALVVYLIAGSLILSLLRGLVRTEVVEDRHIRTAHYHDIENDEGEKEEEGRRRHHHRH